MRNALATLLIIPGVVLFVMAAVALVRFRSRGAGLAFMATRRAAVLSLGMSLAVCSAGSAVAPTDQASVANLSSTDTSALVPPTTRKAATSTVRVTTTSTTSSTRNTVTTFRVAVTTARVSTTTGKPDAPSTTGKPAYVAPPPAAAPQGAPCHPSYDPCVRDEGTDVDCAGGSGNGPRYVQGPVSVNGYDEYDLDRDGDGVGCQS